MNCHNHSLQELWHLRQVEFYTLFVFDLIFYLLNFSNSQGSLYPGWDQLIILLRILATTLVIPSIASSGILTSLRELSTKTIIPSISFMVGSA